MPGEVGATRMRVRECEPFQVSCSLMALALPTPVSLGPLERGPLVATSVCPACAGASHKLAEHRFSGDETIFRVGILRAGESIAYRVCEGCALVFRDPRPSPAALETYYRTICPANENVWPGPSDRGVAYRREKLRHRRLARRLANLGSRGSRVLDVGGGDGGALTPFVARGWRATLVDPGLVGRPPSNEVRSCSSLEELLEQGETYDLVLCLQTLEHVLSPAALLTQLEHALVPEGSLYVEVPYELGLLALAIEGGPVSGEVHAEHINFFSHLSLDRVVSRAGLRVLRSWTELVPSFHGWIPSIAVLARRASDLTTGSKRPEPRGEDTLRHEISRTVSLKLLWKVERMLHRLRGLS
jgi:SAM-dependent methyltransferase